jgi:hypothetical protein
MLQQKNLLLEQEENSKVIEKAKMKPCLYALVLLGIVSLSKASLYLEEIKPEDFVLLRVDVPEDDPYCALMPGLDKLILGFQAKALNAGNEDVHDWTFNWTLQCPYSTREGQFHFECLGDHNAACEEPKYLSCSISGVSPGCVTRIEPVPCNYIDVTGGIENCTLTLDGFEYDLNQVEIEEDTFLVGFIFAFILLGGLSVAAFVNSC